MKVKQKLTQKILRNSLYNLFRTAINKVGALVFTIIIARLLFPELFGIYTLALTIILTLATFTDLSINSTVTRYISESLKIKTAKTKKQARSRFSFLLIFKILITAVIAILLFLFAEIIAVNIFNKPDLILPLQLGSLYLFVFALHNFLISVFLALQKIKYNTIAEIIFQALRIILIIAFFYLYKLNIALVFISLILAFFISIIFLFFILHKKHSFLIKGKKEKVESKRMLKFFTWATLSSISWMIFIQIDIFMLGIFLPAEFIGYYEALLKIILAFSVFVVFSEVMMPVFTQMKRQNLKTSFARVIHYVLIVAIPIAFGLIVLAIPFMRLLYGQAYVPSNYEFVLSITAIIMSLSIIEIAFSRLYVSVFEAKEQPKFPALLVSIGIVFNIILNYIFITFALKFAPQYALIGVAMATVISRYFRFTGLSIIAKKRFKIRFKAKSFLKPFFASIVMLAFLLIFDYFVALNIWRGILMIILAILVYFISMLIIKGITKEDIKIIKLLKPNK